MAGFSSWGDGRYEINSVSVSASEHKAYEKVFNLVHRTSEMKAAQLQQLEQNLTEAFNGPLVRLRGFKWDLIDHSSQHFSAEFQIQALIEALTSELHFAMSAYTAMSAAENLPEGALLRFKQRLQERRHDLSDERMAVIDEVIRRIEHKEQLQAKFSTRRSDIWLEYWKSLVLNGAYHLRRTPKLPPLPTATEREILINALINSRPDELRPAQQSEYEQAVFPGQWWAARKDAFQTLFQENLSESEQAAVISGLVEKEGYPFAGMGYEQAAYERGLYRMVEAWREAGRLSPVALAAVRRSLTQANTYHPLTALKWVNDVITPELNPGEAWSDAILSTLDALPAAERAPWPQLMAFARTASAGKPSGKWLKDAQKHLDAVGAEQFREVLTPALPLLNKPRTFALQPAQYGADPNLTLDEFNALSLKGLLWMLPLVADAALTRTLGGVVESALKKVPGVGPRSPKIANAAVYALSQIESDAALSALARLNTTVTFKGTLKEVQKALEVVSKRLNVTPDDLLDMGTPTLGMQNVGERVDVLGDTEARLTVDAAGAHLAFSKGGKPLKTVPASVKKDFKEELADLKGAQKEAEKSVSALSQRLDSLMIQPKTWAGAAWLEHYLNHPLAGTVARRLIWIVDGVAALSADGELRDVGGESVTVNPDSEVKLWHPIHAELDEVLAWRTRLETLETRQPFKQAWREVYVLTDAERRTDTYSNRFAGHILKQHQFNALASLRGWRNKLRLMVDDSYPPAMRDLPAYGLRAEYWIEGIGENYGEDSTDSGTYLRLTTDQVRFYPIDAPENHAHAGGGGYTQWVNQNQQPTGPLHLADIPPLVLSEILRDVDLFVGVASVGNDPTWQDGGPGGRFREYWQSYSFGELTETAKSRAEYLKRLIPRLKIADRLELEGRFLKVRGERRTYKIHLGSSNILMEPNDQYLCIIPGGKGSGLEVDFDGDRVLSLVLSKAFLLADDTAITDPVILQQLGR